MLFFLIITSRQPYANVCESIFYILIAYLQLLAFKIHRTLSDTHFDVNLEKKNSWWEKKYTSYIEPYFLCPLKTVEYSFENTECSEFKLTS